MCRSLCLVVQIYLRAIVQGLSYEVMRGRKESGVRIAKPSTVCVVKSFKRRNVCIMYGCRMDATNVQFLWVGRRWDGYRSRSGGRGVFVSARSAGVANRDRLYSSAAMNPKNLATTPR